MKFPWVSRTTHDETVAVYERWLDAWRNEAMRYHREYADILGKYHQLRLSGAQIDQVDVSSVPRETSPEPDPVILAVTARSGGDGRKRAMMLAQVRRDREVYHKSDEDILKEIEEGIPAEGMPS